MLADVMRRIIQASGIKGDLIGPSAIATSSAPTATAYSNQRKIDRCSNGVLWAVNSVTGTLGTPYTRYRVAYSTDDGATWTTPTFSDTSHVLVSAGGNNHVGNISFFIDADDYAHVAYKDTADGFIYYRRGTPNAARTAWTWSAAVQASSGSSSDNYPDVVAHREGTGWVAHVIGSQVFSSNTFTWYTPMTITSGGSITKGTTSFIGNGGSGYPSTTPTYPSIDFNHTGDGKTVAGSTPHLYAAWSAGAAGAGKGIRFKKASYNAGSWTWGTEREIDPDVYHAGTYAWLNCLFDGQRVLIGASLNPTVLLTLYERDAADTTTTEHTLLPSFSSATAFYYGSMSYDGEGNVYFVGRNNDESAGTYDLVFRRWVRASNSLESETIIDSGVGNTAHVSAKRGYSNSRIEFVYTDGTTSPYDVTFGGIK